MQDIDQALVQIASVPRRDGETAFPEVAAILDAVRGVIRSRKAAENDGGVRWAKYVEQCKSEGIEQPDAEMLARIESLNDRFNLERPKEITIDPPALVECPHCKETLPLARNLRFFSASELRDLADVVESNERIAANNRMVSVAGVQGTVTQ